MQTEKFENKRWSRGPQTLEFRHEAALTLIEGTSVLDLGCGDGLFLSKIDGSKISRYGADISPVAISKLKERKIDGEVVDMSDGLVPFGDGSFSTVVLLDVLEHLFTPERLLQEAIRVSGEFVVVGVPNFNSLPARVSVLFGKVPENNRPKKGHCYWFNLVTLRRMITESCGQIVAIRTNTFWESRPVIGSIMRRLTRLFPSLFALSFVVKIQKSKSS